jgi:hypothetical protein
MPVKTKRKQVRKETRHELIMWFLDELTELSCTAGCNDQDMIQEQITKIFKRTQRQW